MFFQLVRWNFELRIVNCGFELRVLYAPPIFGGVDFLRRRRIRLRRRFMIEVRRLAQRGIRRGVFAEEPFDLNAKTVTAAVVQNGWQLRRNEGAERNGVEANENQLSFNR